MPSRRPITLRTEIDGCPPSAAGGGPAARPSSKGRSVSSRPSSTRRSRGVAHRREASPRRSEPDGGARRHPARGRGAARGRATPRGAGAAGERRAREALRTDIDRLVAWRDTVTPLAEQVRRTISEAREHTSELSGYLSELAETAPPPRLDGTREVIRLDEATSEAETAGHPTPWNRPARGHSFAGRIGPAVAGQCSSTTRPVSCSRRSVMPECRRSAEASFWSSSR